MPTSKPLRAWLAASGASEIVIDPYGGWNEPSNRAAAILRADPTELASGWAARLEKEPRGAPEAWIAAEAAAQAALDGELGVAGVGTGGSVPDAPISEPALHRALGAAQRAAATSSTKRSLSVVFRLEHAIRDPATRRRAREPAALVP